MEALRKLARIEDRPVSEIVRRAVDRDVEQRSGLLQRGSLAASAFPVFDGGKLPVLLPSYPPTLQQLIGRSRQKNRAVYLSPQTTNGPQIDCLPLHRS